jgi:hypothetical protein
VSFCLALIGATSAAAALSGGYNPIIATNPSSPVSAASGDRFGENIANAGDVNGDGKDDLIVGVPKAPGGLPGITGKVVFVDGPTGGVIATVPVPSPQVSHQGKDTDFGARVATLGDLNGDGVPEHLVSAPGTDLTSTTLDMGRVYVLNGASHQILKQVQLASDDLPSDEPGFGLGLASARGNPPCAGNGGIGACPYPPSSLVAAGDLDGGGKPDIVIGAPDYAETADTDPEGCNAPGVGSCPGLPAPPARMCRTDFPIC